MATRKKTAKSAETEVVASEAPAVVKAPTKKAASTKTAGEKAASTAAAPTEHSVDSNVSTMSTPSSVDPVGTVAAVPHAAEPKRTEMAEKPGTSPIQMRIVPSRELVARRAYALYRQGGENARENWLRAERELARVMLRAHELFEGGSRDAFANWVRAEREVASGDQAV